ncbi:adenylyltransferase/cytidyltransferase family protein [Candidatus Falkowbacteria bacterium]|nr:adenylyltransferase/cytidyltransferase family protein [Candidatus Falkowbacteria bacterium]
MSIVFLKDLNELIWNIKNSGKKIVLTTGVFDILNPGHLYYLKDASRFGDVLFVGIDCDKLVKQNKGPFRPIYSQMERAILVNGLKSVSYVVIFGNINKLIRRIKPHVFVISPTTKIVRGKRLELTLVGKYGGKIVVIKSRYKKHSSDFIEKIRRAEKI